MTVIAPAQTPIPPPPRTNDMREIHRWLINVFRALGRNSVAWDSINFTGSDLDDLETKNHNDLDARDATAAHPATSITNTASGIILSLTLQAVVNELAKIIGSIRTEVAAYLITLDDCTILGDATAGAFSVSLPSAAAATGRTFSVGKIDTSLLAVTIDPDGAELINGESTFALKYNGEVLTFQSDGTGWFIR